MKIKKHKALRNEFIRFCDECLNGELAEYEVFVGARNSPRFFLCWDCLANLGSHIDVMIEDEEKEES